MPPTAGQRMCLERETSDRGHYWIKCLPTWCKKHIWNEKWKLTSISYLMTHLGSAIHLYVNSAKTMESRNDHSIIGIDAWRGSSRLTGHDTTEKERDQPLTLSLMSLF